LTLNSSLCPQLATLSITIGSAVKYDFFYHIPLGAFFVKQNIAFSQYSLIECGATGQQVTEPPECNINEETDQPQPVGDATGLPGMVV
jgi:hypothetical protein